MASPPLRGSAEWSAKREVAVLLGLTRGNHYAAQKLWLQIIPRSEVSLWRETVP